MLKKFHLPISKDGLELENETLLKAVSNDKKTRGKQLKIILLETIGTAKIVTMDTSKFRDYLGMKEEK